MVDQRRCVGEGWLYIHIMLTLLSVTIRGLNVIDALGFIHLNGMCLCHLELKRLVSPQTFNQQ